MLTGCTAVGWAATRAVTTALDPSASPLPPPSTIARRKSPARKLPPRSEVHLALRGLRDAFQETLQSVQNPPPPQPVVAAAAAQPPGAHGGGEGGTLPKGSVSPLYARQRHERRFAVSPGRASKI
eukprot:SAG22_NODE_537_length_9361_cov_53.700821_2_plen_125_part_00